MSRRCPITLLMFAGLFLGSVSVASAATFAVGSCRPTLPSYTTISAAVSDPVTASATILVCAGTYQEQVLITHPLTLEGVPVGQNSAAEITLPSGTLQIITSPTLGGVAYQIAVVNPGGLVNLKNLIVDGTGGVLQSGEGFCSGIFYQDASGALNNVAARNQACSGSGFGVISISGDVVSGAQSFTLKNSSIGGFDNTGLLAYGAGSPLAVTVQSNFVDGLSSSQFGMNFDFSVTGTVSSNTITEPPFGLTPQTALQLFGSGVSATGNSIHGAIYIDGGSNTVTVNRIDAEGGVGVALSDASTSKFESNTIMNATFAIYGCLVGNYAGATASGFTVTHNTLQNAGIGISTPAGNTITPNTFNLIPAAVQACP